MRTSVKSYCCLVTQVLIYALTVQVGISNNVGSVKNCLSILLRSLLRAFSFVVFFGPASTTTARS
jgi:hypothetical protein